MPVSYILQQSGNKMGLDPSEAPQRSVLLRFLNEAARELYTISDMPNSLWEACFKVNGDQTITLPYYVGELRAVRELASQAAWNIHQMRPRYNQFNWKDMWRNWRIKNDGPLQSTVTNQSVGILQVHSVENPPVQVTVSGPTETASEAFETVVMDATVKQTVHQYTDYTSVKKNRANNCDVFLKDVDGKILSTIPNNQLCARYQVVDISTLTWLPNSGGSQDHYVEVLYKKSLNWLSNDADEFPAQGYDDVLVNKMMQLWCEEQGKGDEAVGYDAKATRTLARITENKNRETEDEAAFVANPHDTLLPRIRSNRSYYWRRSR